LRVMTGYIHPLAAPFSLEGDRPDAVLLLHGWTGSPAHLRVLGTELNEAGFPVHAPLLAGHGTSLDDMTQTGWRDWMRSAVEGALLVSNTGRLHLVGLSMGGLMALLMARSSTPQQWPQSTLRRRCGIGVADTPALSGGATASKSGRLRQPSPMSCWTTNSNTTEPRLAPSLSSTI